ncbi:MAG: helix-turn-helix transcriptional regulator [Lachnospiraceae bacterium]|nr:helix-turn-helix transcriptional regulator [Lachnospiraceae bacterium]
MPSEIMYALQKQSILIGNTESHYLFLDSRGWMPAIRLLVDRFKQSGKAEVYHQTGCILPERTDKKQAKGDKETLPGTCPEWAPEEQIRFRRVRQAIEAFDREEAHIALEQLRMNAERCSETDDCYAYYRAILGCLEGKGRIAVEQLRSEFELRIAKGETESAKRILLAEIETGIFLGQEWYEEEADLVRALVARMRGAGCGISRVATAMSLLYDREYYKLIAMFEERGEEDPAGQCYRAYFLAAAYREIGYLSESERWLREAESLVKENRCLLPSFLFFVFFPLSEKIADQPERRVHKEKINEKRRYRDKLELFRSAIKRNSEGHVSDPKKLLSVRETEIIELVVQGFANKEIADKLAISENTVKSALKRVFRKLGIESRKELMNHGSFQ